MRVLLIEDDRAIGSAVRDHVAAQGHGVDWAQSLENADEYLSVSGYDLILLDLGLPDGNGITLLRALRAGRAGGDAQTPVVILSAQDQIAQRIEGLNAGADDYLVKPFDLSELSARFAAVIRRAQGQASPARRFGPPDAPIAIDFALRRIERAGAAVEITAREWAVLERLTRRPNARVAKSEIEDSLYAFGAEVESNTVEVYVSRLRKKLGKGFITTLRGIGYMVPEQVSKPTPAPGAS